MAGAAVGTKFYIGTTTGSAVAELSSIGGLSLSADTVESTSLDSTGGYRTFVQGFKDGGEVSLSGFFNPGSTASQKTLYTNYDNGTIATYTIAFPTAISANWQFSGIVTAIETGAELEDNVTFDCTLKVTGKPVLNA